MSPTRSTAARRAGAGPRGEHPRGPAGRLSTVVRRFRPARVPPRGRAAAAARPGGARWFWPCPGGAGAVGHVPQAVRLTLVSAVR